MITIFTPTYNREATLSRLFESLLLQTSSDFEWLVVDDGSTDGTCLLLEDMQRKNTSFPIRYVKQENGGKHSAINKGLELARGELFFIVDSDDWLTPDAVQTICSDWEQVRSKNLCGIAYLRGDGKGQVIGDQFPEDHVIDNFVEVRFNQGVDGDKAEVWVTSIMRQFPYPVFAGEKFMGETWNFIQQSDGHDMLWVNQIIYRCEYLQGGLSQSGRKLRIRCPLGGRAMALMAMGEKFKMKVRLKNAMLMVAYSLFARYSVKKILDNRHWFLTLLMLPEGFVLYLVWKHKYL